MARTSGYVAAPVESVWGELSDGWGFSSWVVGTIKIRAVDPAWPEEGAKLHHAVGAWPLTLQDETEVQTCEPMSRLVMVARGWPVGEAVVDIRLTPDAVGCRVEMLEEPVAGPGAWLNNPVVDRVGRWRLEEMHDRFTKLVEGRYALSQLR
jgi:Polyketide cyclase / dehydrase and lipid transport